MVVLWVVICHENHETFLALYGLAHSKENAPWDSLQHGGYQFLMYPPLGPFTVLYGYPQRQQPSMKFKDALYMKILGTHNGGALRGHSDSES